MRVADDPIDTDPKPEPVYRVEHLRACTGGGVWHHTTAHRAVTQFGGVRESAWTGFEFVDQHGKTVMLFPGRNDTIIVTEE